MEGEKGYKKGLWAEDEDRILMDYVRVNGKGRWNRIAKMTGLKRCGKSCRLRWINYLSPNIKHGDFSEEEDDLIIRLHNLLGNSDWANNGTVNQAEHVSRFRLEKYSSIFGQTIDITSKFILWSLIAGRVPGRTDNQVKNHWNTHLSKKLGIRKGIRTKVNRGSSQTLSPKVPENNVNNPMDTSFEPHLENNNDRAGDQRVVKDGFQSNVGLAEVEEPVVNESFESPFWISHIDAPSLLDLFDQFSPDFVWHSL